MHMSAKRWLLIAVCIILLAAISVGAVYLFAVYLPRKKGAEDWARMMKEYYNAKVAQYEKENGEYVSRGVDVVFLGDSLTDGYDLSEYYPQYVTANRGIGGDTTDGLLARMKVSVYDVKPEVAVMLIGVNNIDTMLDNYEELLVGMSENLPETELVLVSLTPMSGDYAYRNPTAAYNNVVIRMLAEEYGCRYVDMYTPLFDVETGELRAEYTPDGLHFTPAGYRVYTDVLTPVLEDCMK